MIKKNIKKNNRGFVILFAVTLSAILLSIALGVVNISLREIKFGTSAKDTNNAFFAADVGSECALYYDRSNPADNAFTGTASMNCAGSAITLGGSSPIWNFTISGLGSGGQGCAKVIMDKTDTTDPVIYTIISSGYNNNGGGSCTQGPNTVERQIETSYCASGC